MEYTQDYVNNRSLFLHFIQPRYIPSEVISLSVKIIVERKTNCDGSYCVISEHKRKVSHALLQSGCNVTVRYKGTKLDTPYIQWG